MDITFSIDDADFEADALTVVVAADTSTTLTLEQFMSPSFHGTYSASLTATAGSEVPETVTVTFTITIVDPCAGPLPITPPTLADITYLITDVDNEFFVPPFEVEPSDCEMTVTFSVDDNDFEADALTVVVASDTSTTLTLAQFMSPTFHGSYTATLTATAGS